MSGRKGQTSVEYLVTLSVVMLVGMAALSVITSLYPAVPGVSEAESRTYWQGQATPLRIIEATLGNGLGCADVPAASYGYKLLLQNADATKVSLRQVIINGAAKPFCVVGANMGEVFDFDPAQRRTINVLGLNCTPGQIVEASVNFVYDKYPFSSRVQNGTKKLYARCTDANLSSEAGEGGATGPLNLNILTSALPAGKVGQSYSASLSATGARSYLWSCGNLPPGLSCGSSGAISGTPTLAGTYAVQLTVTDNRSQTASATVPLNVIAADAAPLSISSGSLPDAAEDTGYSVTIASAGGSGTKAWAAGGLPLGLSMSPAGTISGTPPLGAAGSYVVRVSVADSTGASVFADMNLTVLISGSLSIATSSLADATVGATYAAPLAATGSVEPYTWSCNNLPPGLSCSNAGILSGTVPYGAEGNYTITLNARDSRPTGQQMNASRQVSLRVNSPASGPLTITTQSLSAATEGQSYSATLSATGGTGNYSWSATGLPSGLNASTLGIISGTPSSGTAGTTYSSVATVYDGVGYASKSLSLQVILPTITISGSISPAMVGQAYSAAPFSASGGSGNYAWSITNLPPGISAGGASGNILSGTPTTAGTWNVSVGVYDNGYSPALFTSTTTPFIIRPTSWLSISPSSLPSGTYGVLYNQSLTATGTCISYHASPYMYVSAGSLPSGLTFTKPPSGANGYLAGVPSAGGTSTFSITAYCYYDGTSVTQSYSVQINYITLTLYCPSQTTATTGVSYSSSLSASGGTGTGYTYSTGTLPPGLTRSGATISGTPSASGTYNYSASVTDSAGNTASSTCSLAVYSPLSITTSSLPSGMVGTAYSATLSASGGTGTGYTYSIISGSLPAGLSLTSSTGVISGTPTSIGSTFTVRVTDSGGNTASKDFTISVYPALSLSCPASTATVGVLYNSAAVASGGTGSGYSYGFSGLPSLLSGYSNGTVSGTPNAAGTYAVTASVTDSAGNYKSQSCTITVYSGLSLSCPASSATLGVAYSSSWTASGGSGSYSGWAIQGTLPPSLTAGTPSGSSRPLTGTPSTAGSYFHTITVNDSLGNTNTASCTINVACPSNVTITTSSLPSATKGTFYSATLSATGGVGGATYTWSCSGLPPGLSCSASEGTISGTPTSTGTYTVTVTATAATCGSATKTFTLYVYYPPVVIACPTPTATVGTSYSSSATVSGGTGTGYWWSGVVYGSLPPGLSAPGGYGSFISVSGTPNASGNYSFTLYAGDSVDNTGMGTCSIFVSAPADTTPPTLSVSPTTITCGVVTLTATASDASGIQSISIYEGPYSEVLLVKTCASSPCSYTTGLNPGTYYYRASATDNSPNHNTATTSQSSFNAISVATTSPLPAGVVSRAYSYALSATGGSGYSWSCSGLPPGLSCSTSGVISGTPTTAGNSTVSATVTASGGSSCSGTFSLTIYPAMYLCQDALLPTGSAGQPYSFNFAPSCFEGSGIPPYTWSIATGANLLINSSGVVYNTGSPPLKQGITQVTISVQDSGSAATSPQTVSTNPFNFAVTSGPLAITTTTMANATQGASYSDSVSVTGGTGGINCTFGVGKPSSLFNGANTCTLFTASGEAGVTDALGTYSFPVTATDSSGASVTKTVNLTIVYPTFEITTTSFSMRSGGSYGPVTISTINGISPVTWLTMGYLPDGLNFSGGLYNGVYGYIYGTVNKTPGSYTTWLQARDGNYRLASKDNIPIYISCAASGQSCTADYQCCSSAPYCSEGICSTCSGVSITTSSLPGGTSGHYYSTTLSATGGSGTYSWSCSGLPTGLSCSASGVISGTPTTTGTSTITATATGSVCGSGSRSYSLIINAPTGCPTSSANVGQAYNFPLTSLGNLGCQWQLNSGTLPPGLSITPTSPGTDLTGTPTTAGTYSFSLSSGGCSQTYYTTDCSITVSGCGSSSECPSGQYCDTITNPYTCQALSCGTCYYASGNSCVPSSSGTACNDGNACTTGDVCNGAGSCIGSAISCNSPSTCYTSTGAYCSGGSCVYPYAASGTSCNDGNACTTGDVCNGAGTCSGTAISCNSPPICRTTTGAYCSGGSCVYPYAASGTSCSDGNACTTGDVCNGAGTCSGTQKSCTSPPGQCYNSPGACYDTQTGVCDYTLKAAGTSCDDGNACTYNDVCNNGACSGTSYSCTSPPNQCYNSPGTCNGAGGCSYSPKTSGTACNDGNSCTSGDVCNGAGTCSGTQMSCNSPPNSCYISAGYCSGGTCYYYPKEAGLSCSDGNACTTGETCNGAGSCTGGTTISCNSPPNECYNSPGTCSGGTCSYSYKTDGTACSVGWCYSGYCYTCKSVGYSCMSGSQCCSGTCTGGVCQSCYANGHSCNKNSDCCVNLCIAGYCGDLA